MRCRASSWTFPLALFAATACGGTQESRLPDYSEWLHAGVDPRAEADALSEGLARAGFHETRRIAAERWVAIEARSDDDRRAIRVATRVGAALVLDSHEDGGMVVRHGAVELLAPPLPGSHDVDGDGHDEVLVGARAGDRTCILPFRVQDDDTILPVPPDLGSLGPDACVERLEDVDGDGRLEGIAVLRISEPAGTEIPQIEVPLMLDGSARMRAGPPPVAWAAAQRGERTRALEAARAEHDLDAILRIAIELAAIARTENASIETQLGVFDRTIAGAVWTLDRADDVIAARHYLENDWALSPPPPPEP